MIVCGFDLEFGNNFLESIVDINIFSEWASSYKFYKLLPDQPWVGMIRWFFVFLRFWVGGIGVLFSFSFSFFCGGGCDMLKAINFYNFSLN